MLPLTRYPGYAPQFGQQSRTYMLMPPSYILLRCFPYLLRIKGLRYDAPLEQVLFDPEKLLVPVVVGLVFGYGRAEKNGSFAVGKPVFRKLPDHLFFRIFQIGVEDRLYYGEISEDVPKTEAPEMIFSWESKIEKAERLLGISRLPLIQDRMELLDTMMRQAFLEVKPGTEPELPEFADQGRVMTAIERLKHDYFTIKQLADHFEITDDAVRSNLRKYKIPTYRFGGQTLVPYREFAAKMGMK